MDIEEQVGSEMPDVEDQTMYTDRDFARMVAYLWKLDDEQYMEEFGFSRSIGRSRGYYEVGRLTRVELHRFRWPVEENYRKSIHKIMKKLNEQNKSAKLRSVK